MLIRRIQNDDGHSHKLLYYKTELVCQQRE